MKRLKTSFNVDPELLEEVKIASIRRRTSITEALDAGLRSWLRSGETPGLVGEETLRLAKEAATHSGVGVSEVIEKAVQYYVETQLVIPPTEGVVARGQLSKTELTTPSDDINVMLQWALDVLVAPHPASVALAWNIATFRGAIFATRGLGNKHDDNVVTSTATAEIIPATEEERLRLAEQILERIIEHRKSGEAITRRNEEGGNSVPRKRPA